MKYQWIDKNVDRDSLLKAIVSFLKDKKFKIRRDDSEDSCKILGTFRTSGGEIRSVSVTVSGTSNDLAVELKVGDQAESLLKFSFLISLFGGGPLLIKKRQSAEFYKKFEEDFWRYVESKV